MSNTDKLAIPASLTIRKLDHNFNNAEGNILFFDQIELLTMSNPLWREFIGNRMALERRYGALLQKYEEAFSNYFRGYFPMDYRSTGHDAMLPDSIVKLVLTLAEHSLSATSTSSDSASSDTKSIFEELGWEDVQAKNPCWALLSDTYAAAVEPPLGGSVKSGPRFFSSRKHHGNNPIVLHVDGVSDHELKNQLIEAKEKGCIGVMVEIIENNYSGRVLSIEILRRLAALCAEENLLLAVDETLTAIRCGSPFSFQREEYFDLPSPDIVFFGRSIGVQGTAIAFDGQFLNRFGILEGSRQRAIRKWQSQFHKPLPTAELVQAISTLKILIQRNFTMLSRIIGQAIRTFILEQVAKKGQDFQSQDILGGLESLIFVRKDIAGEFLVMGAKTGQPSEVLEEVIGCSSEQAREDLSKLLLQKGAKPSWCFWCGNPTTSKKDDWCQRCCIGVCDQEVCGRHLSHHTHV
nr:uncharacterized protein CTRU02_12114 [Colletotrichum truncatum]KAF6784903.1 hypothetical protein CTRU02_12114 [Colletotrichum truncatum]